MKISDNILVGLEFHKLCERFGDLRIYANELNVTYEHSKDEILIGLIIYSYTKEEDNIEYLNHLYYTLTNDGIKEYQHLITKEMDICWIEDYIDLSLLDIEKKINEQPYIHDMNYFYKNM